MIRVIKEVILNSVPYKINILTKDTTITEEEAIAWLEKQGEHADFRNKIQIGDKVTRNKDGVLVNLSQLNRVAKKQGEQKSDNVIEEEKTLLEKFKQAVYDCAWGKVTCKKEGETKEEYANRLAEQFLLIVRDWADDYIDFTIQQKLRNSYEKGKTDVIEKQCEQNPVDTSELEMKRHNEGYVKGVHDAFNNVNQARSILKQLRKERPQQDMLSQEKYAKAVDECIYGEQKPVDNKMPCNPDKCIYVQKYREKEKPAWSEEDEKILSTIIKEGDLKPSERQWLKSLKGRVLPQPNLEWSEEDESMLYGVIETEQYMLDVVNGVKTFDVGNEQIESQCIKELAWLKILKDRYTWKPSDEQIIWLYRAADDASKDSRMKQVLKELLFNLKKLKGQSYEN